MAQDRLTNSPDGQYSRYCGGPGATPHRKSRGQVLLALGGLATVGCPQNDSEHGGLECRAGWGQRA